MERDLFPSSGTLEVVMNIDAGVVAVPGSNVRLGVVGAVRLLVEEDISNLRRLGF